MRNIQDLLKRFASSLDKDLESKQAVINTIKERTNITLKIEDLNLKNGVLEINASPMVKSEINLKEEAIKNELKSSYNVQVNRLLYK